MTIASVLSAVLFIFHWSDEISRGFEPGTLNAAGGVAILVVWLAGPLVLGDRRSGYIVTLIGGILGLGILLLHMSGRGLVGGRMANTSGQFFWVSTAITMGVSSAIAGILAVRGLWSFRRRNSL
jgi:hypothetical protein